MLQAGQKVYAAPTGKLDPATGLPVYEGSCGLEFVPGFTDMLTAFVVAQQTKSVGGTPVFGMARCNQHQALNQWRVVAIPQAKVDPATGLPVYSFLCCPGQVQSGSGSGSGFGPAFHFPQESGIGLGSGSGSGGGVGQVTIACCTNPINTKLFLSYTSLSNTGPCNFNLPATIELDYSLTANPPSPYNADGWISKVFSDANGSSCTFAVVLAYDKSHGIPCTWSVFSLLGGAGGAMIAPGRQMDSVTCSPFSASTNAAGGNIAVVQTLSGPPCQTCNTIQLVSPCTITQ